jgi:hypothetical protein
MLPPNNFVSLPEKYEALDRALGLPVGDEHYRQIDEHTLSMMWDLCYRLAILLPDDEWVRAFCERFRVEVPRQCTCPTSCRQPCRGDCGCVYCAEVNGEFGYANSDD